MKFGGFQKSLCSYNVMMPNAGFTSAPLSLSIPKMESLGEMSILGENREDELESRSGSDNFEAVSGDDLDNTPQHHNITNSNNNKPSRRKKYHRHTAFQIQELEGSFKDNPHPDEKARLELGKRLGLEGRQVKFWFQNRRTQMKTQLERHENSILKQENDKLRIENIAMKEAMRSPMCENCGSPALLGEVPIEQHHLMIENARLKDELKMFRVLSGKFLGGGDSKLDLSVGMNGGGYSGLNSMDNVMNLGLDFGNRVANPFPVMSHNGMNMMSFDKSMFLELAMAGMDELIKLAQLGSPVWFKNEQGNGESLNLDEYMKMFSPCIGVKPGHFVTEATRASGNVIINVATLVETLMDAKQWTEMFPWSIGSASILDVISPGTGGSRNGALHLMQAEFQIPSPLVPVRQVKFVRFCKQHGDDTWAVVDVSVDSLFHGNMPVNCRRLPSGCIVQFMPNGYSKVSWIEHTEYNEEIVHHLYRPLLRSGMAFGAQKWVSYLQRQCELFDVIVPSPNDQLGLDPSGKRSMVKLAQRMTRSFCTGVCSTVNKWEGVQGADNIKLMMRKSMGNCGEPHGVILSATTTVWMPVSPQHLFEFLQDEKTRSNWDVLSQDGPLQQMLRIPKAQDLANSITLLRTTGPSSSSNKNNVLILQETSVDASGSSLIVHAAVDTSGMNIVMGGGDSSGLAILPSGFGIMPDCRPESEGNLGGGGSLLTVGFQILVSQAPAAELTMESVETVKSLISRTLEGIKDGLHCN